LAEKFINKCNGHLLFSNDFEVSANTKTDELVLYFGQENVKITDMKNGWKHYVISNIKTNSIYFLGTLYFENDTLAFVSFGIDDKLITTDSWDNWSEENELQKRDYYDNWLTDQLGIKREFSWGIAGAFYDNKSGYSSINLRYCKPHV
jgi:hypothetical protein